jgi:hypothetical protein
MQFTPKKEEELGFNVFPAGTYPFQVTSAEDKVSKSGNEMIELKLYASSSDGSTTVVRDWLLEAMAAKLRHFCYGTGLGETYMNGSIDASFCQGVQGYVVLDRKPYTREDGTQGVKNVVKDYLKKDQWPASSKPKQASSAVTASASPASEKPEEDDVPW